jgi:Uma2 family endonuclease
VSEPRRDGWTIDEFFAWQDNQPDRYELVGGTPVRLPAGAKNVHDDILVNVLTELRRQLQESGCRPFTRDSSIETLPGQIRRPDVGADCGYRDPTGTRAITPRMVAEVLAPDTSDVETFERLREYKQVSTLGYILLIEPSAPMVMRWLRNEDRSWQMCLVNGLGQEIAMPALGVTLVMEDIYDGVTFPTHPGPGRLS